MRRILSIGWAVAALACGSVQDKQACSVSTDCPAGQYCARAEGEARCWADAAPPVVGTVTASCAGGCLRDGVLTVQATVTDDAEVLDASVSLGLPGGSPVQMTRSGDAWVADVPLRAFAFPYYAHDVVATVTARDGARNASDPKAAGAVGVTRLRWWRQIDSGAVVTPTVPAVKSDGTVIIGGSNGKVYFVAPDGSDARAPLAVGAGAISAAPAIGADTIWVGSEDFNLYALKLDGSDLKSGVGVNTGGAIKGSVAVLPGSGKEWAFATSSAGFVGVASTVSAEYAIAGPTSAFAVGPVVRPVDRAYAGSNSGSVRAYRLNTSPAVTLTDTWGASAGVEIAAPLAIDAEGTIWAPAVEKLNKVIPGDTGGAITLIATLPARIVDSPLVLVGGDLIIGDSAGVLHRYTSAGTPLWSTELSSGFGVHAPVALAGGDAPLLVPSANGDLFARGTDGAAVWSATLDSGNALRAPNIFTPPGQTSNVMSTLYVASAGGKLFAVIVDGQLDASAPWPKAFHDPRNTNRAGPQP